MFAKPWTCFGTVAAKASTFDMPLEGGRGVPQVAPKPDSTTGEPRPPRAPVVTTWKTEGKTHRAKADVPPAPDGEGPMLEWYQAEGTEMVKGGFALSALIIAFGCLRDGGVAWMATWWLWLFVFWPPVVFYFLGRSGGYAAGADWLATRKKGYVKLYELSSVKVEHTAGGQSLDISLTDKRGGSARASLRQLQRKRALWDLVYNGIAYSVLHGPATANDKALEKLQLR